MEDRLRELELKVVGLEASLRAAENAKELQAVEYERRLKDLNNEASRIADVLSKSVTAEKFEDYTKNEADKRELALQRVDEKFEDYVKRYEARQREVDIALTTQKTAAEAAQRFAEEAVQKANRNISLLGVGLAALVVVMNLIGAI